MVYESMLLPAPHPQHAAALSQIASGIERRIQAGAGRGLVVVQMLPKDRSFRSGFTPEKSVDTAHVIAMGLPEEAATEIAQKVKEYDDLTSVPVLMIEQIAAGRIAWSYILLDVRPVGPGNTGETRH